MAFKPLPLIIPKCQQPLELALKPPFENLELLEPIKCTKINSTNLNLGLVPHLSREEHFTEPPWHIKKRERQTIKLLSVAHSIVFES